MLLIDAADSFSKHAGRAAVLSLCWLWCGVVWFGLLSPSSSLFPVLLLLVVVVGCGCWQRIP
jgi:hypothetical protein